MKKFRVTVNGKPYEVEVELPSEAKSYVTAPPFESAKIHAGEAAPAPKKAVINAPAGSGDVVSPLSGKIVSIDAAVGTSVTEGQKVITMEAMKMNTFVLAPRAGKVKEVLVTVGQAVEEAVTLARLE